MAKDVVGIAFVVGLVISGCAKAPREEAVPAPAPEAQAAACRLSDNTVAWGVDGNSGLARQWLLGQCALAHEGVITYVEPAPTCRDQQDQAACETADLLGSCGGVQVALVAAECRNCQPACITADAKCEPPGTCSNTGERCDNDEQCSFSAPVDGACQEGSTLAQDWAGYYALMGGSGPAPMTYCTWG